MRLLSVLAAALPLLSLAAGPAAAQAVPPIGRWASAAGNVLVVNEDATCTYSTAQLQVQGSCSWHASGQKDGVLFIDAAVPGQSTRHLDVSIHWIDRERVTVLGEPFVRR